MSLTDNHTENQKTAAPYLDVWTRASRVHRLRAVLMLLVLALLFAGLCCFSFWLRTGTYLPWQYDDYGTLMRRSFNPFGSSQMTLSDFLSSPIPVQEVPVHAVIMGLLFASLSSIPILVVLLYRLPLSILFAAMVIFLAGMPWMGLTVLIGCMLASFGLFRFSFRYASALIGLIPVAIYFILASWRPFGSPTQTGENLALLYAPWVLALLGSCVICAVALAIARVIDYRPGGIPAILAMLFAIPVYLFHTQVGRDELEYRLLEREIGPNRSSFYATMDFVTLAQREALRNWSEAKQGAYDDYFRQMLRKIEDRALLQVERDRFGALSQCDAFLERYPKSRYVSNVLYLKGQTQDGRMDLSKHNRFHHPEFRYDLPNRSSRQTWQTLIERFPTSGPSATARYKLARLMARKGDFDTAIPLLDELIDRFDVSKTATQPTEMGQSVMGAVFHRSPPSSSLRIDLASLVRRGRHLREMLIACRNDQPKRLSLLFGSRSDGSDMAVTAVQILMRLDPANNYHRYNLENLRHAFVDSEAAGYVTVRLAVLESAVSRRIQRLREAAVSLTGRPSGAEALFFWGNALQEDSLLDEASSAFEDLVRVYPQSCWSQEAKDRLASLAILKEAARNDTP